MTQLGAALRDAGLVLSADRLRQIARDALREHPQDWQHPARIEWDYPVNAQLREIAVSAMTKHANNWDAAKDEVYAAVRHDPALLWELFGAFRSMAVQKLLNEVNREMREHMEAARQRETAQGGGQTDSANHTRTAPTVLQGDRGQQQPDIQTRASPVSRPITEAQRSAVAYEANIVRMSMLDTFQIDGQPIGDVQAGPARAWARKTGRHVRWVEMLTANMPHDDPIRRWITADDAATLWERAAGADDAA